MMLAAGLSVFLVQQNRETLRNMLVIYLFSISLESFPALASSICTSKEVDKCNLCSSGTVPSSFTTGIAGANCCFCSRKKTSSLCLFGSVWSDSFLSKDSDKMIFKMFPHPVSEFFRCTIFKDIDECTMRSEGF